ncbi:hypothetical protein SLS58_008723 [Diplodia intermedia]|uniref:Mg2+ transporter zinc transport protein n=1 Tax=Diplodia intermedia TaxID=856260 RepID=A0ABR3TGQ2_9PEZI
MDDPDTSSNSAGAAEEKPSWSNLCTSLPDDDSVERYIYETADSASSSITSNDSDNTSITDEVSAHSATPVAVGSTDSGSTITDAASTRHCRTFIEFSENEVVSTPSEESIKECLSDIHIGEKSDIGKPHGQQASSSFGDEEGTTASVNMYGDILQISRFLGGGPTDHFCVDPGDNEYHWPKHRPFLVEERAEWLWDLAKTPAEGVGLRLERPSEQPTRIEQDPPGLAYIDYRWPRFTYSTANFDVVRQYFSKRGAIIQQCKFKRKETTEHQTTPDDVREGDQQKESLEDPVPNASSHATSPPDDPSISTLQDESNDTAVSQVDSPAWPIFKLETNFFIRNLDRYDDNEFNKDELTSRNYHFVLGPNSHSLLVVHQRPFSTMSTAQQSAEVVGLVIMPFVNGEVCKVENVEGWNDYNGNPQYRIEHEAHNGSKELETTISYRLQRLRTANNPWQSLLIRASDIDVPVNGHLSEISLSSTTYLDFIMKRNVQHILHAFQFLLEMYPRVKEKSDDDDTAAEHLLLRLRRTCHGHLNWLFQEHRFRDGEFSNNSDITGKAHYTSTTNHCLQSTARIFIQAKSYLDAVGESNDQSIESLKRRVGSHIDSWIASLQRRDPRDNFVFGPKEYKEDAMYFLRNQALVWAALEAIEELDLDQSNLRIYLPETARKKMRKRFITENPVSHGRMLAVRRSTLESSFRITDGESPLFYHSSFLHTRDVGDDEKPNLIKEWENLVDAQRYHKKNQDMDWTSPVCYGVAMMMAKQGKSVNSKSASDMFDEATTILLRSCLPNGLFAGLLDRRTRAPVFHDSVDYQGDYWWDSFELPYLLCKAGVEPKESQSKKQGQPKSGPPQLDMGESGRKMIMEEYMSFKNLLEHQGLIDGRNISEYPDEWLWECPDFLHYIPSEEKESRPLSTQQSSDLDSEEETDSIHSLQDGEADLNPRRHECSIPGPESRQILEAASVDVVGLIAHDMGECTDKKAQFVRNCDIEDRMCQCRASKREALIKKGIMWLPWGHKDTPNFCLSAASESQKPGLTAFFERHQYHEKFFFDDPTAADNSWVTEFQLSFYQLHDDKNGAQRNSQGKETSMALERSFDVDDALLSKKPSQGTHKVIRRGTMGFRFYGDFFDRYWNCHFVEQNRKDGPDKLAKKGPIDFLDQALALPEKLPHRHSAKKGQEKQKEPWRQRKLLELLIFDQMIEEINKSTETILEEIRRAFRNPKEATSDPSNNEKPDALLLSQMDSKTYFLFSQKWQTLEQLLQILEDDLAETLLRVSSWERREKDRGSERPRWTKKDERSYRGDLRKMLVSNSKRVAQLRRLQASVQSLRASLSSKRDSIRDDLSLRGSEDIRYFTYVTVVFLPLGFASSMFSMSGSPTNATVGSMVVTAVIALFTTSIVLWAMSWYHNPKRWQARWEKLKKLKGIFSSQDEREGDVEKGQS